MRAASSIAIATSGVLAAQWAPGTAVVSPLAARLIGVPTTVRSERGVLLTFDDGPHPQGTPAVLTALAARGAPAVFFVVGEQASRYPELVSEIVAAGHEVGVHGYRHQTRRQWSRKLLVEDTLRTIDAISGAVVTVPRLYRPPHGVFSLTGLRTIRRLELTPLLWSKWGRDWERGANVSTITKRATLGIAAGDVVLLHDADHYGAKGSWRKSAASLAAILDTIATVGLEPASVRAGSEHGQLALSC